MSSPFGVALSLVPTFAAALSVFLAARQRQGKAKKGWYLIGIGIMAFGLGSCIWSYFDLTGQPRPYPSVADIAFLLLGPLCAAGLLNLIPAFGSRNETVKVGLDLAITISALGLYGWFFFLTPSVVLQMPPFQTFVSLAYPVVDLLILSLVLVLISHQWHDRAAITKFVLIGLGLLTQVLGDVAFYNAVASNAYYAKHPLEVLWTLGPVFFVLSARTSLVASQRPTTFRLKEQTPDLVASAKPYLTGALPYLAVVSSLVLLFTTQSRTSSQNTLGDQGVLYGVGLVIVLVLARQLFSSYENGKLTRRLTTQRLTLQTLSATLESKVQERTFELETLSTRFQYDARHDPLTGLANRTRLQECLEEAVADKSFLAVLYLDFDRFKAINDSYGHEVGDQLLVAIATRLRARLRRNDVVARLGGDEFAVLLRISQDTHVTTIAEKLTQAFQEPFQVGDYLLYSTASIGVVVSEGRENTQHVLRDADIAMYQAKALGKSRYVIFESAMSEVIQTRLALENDLRKAIERHELEIHYQPIIDATAEGVVGFEALVRWQHPRHGLISPVTFIPLAEESNLIVDIDRWVLQNACAQLKAWDALNDQLTLSVNFSGRQFAQPDLPLFVAGVLTKHGLVAHRLQLELTERLLLDNSVQVRETLKALRELSVRFHIDDFGTGYSSLSYLQRFDADLIKIDRSFVMPMLENSDSEKLVQTIINLAHNLDMKVVAEGVETEAQARRLKDLDCDFLQGFLFAKPLPATAAGRYLEIKSDPERDEGSSADKSCPRDYRMN